MDLGQINGPRDRWLVAARSWLGWGDETRKKKKEKEAVCGFLWPELGTQSLQEGQGWEPWGSPGVSPLEGV